MSLRTFFIMALVATALAAGWRYRHAEAVQSWLQPRTSTTASFNFYNDDPPERDAGGPATTGAPVWTPGSIRKCHQAGKVVYTDSLCPPGSKEHAIKGGTVNVLPGQRAASGAVPAEASASHRPTVRDLLVPPSDVNLRDKHMERMMGE